ncbi:MAG TPA: glycosyl hydrolase 115 family protein [Sphingomonas sp.]|jgi:hypothetical protein|nr:glycosyl hydrolase 115 family protein [Sphingomonas sp.]
MTRFALPLILALMLLIGAAPARAGMAVIYDGRAVATIVRADDPAMRHAADMLGDDLKALTGHAPRIVADAAVCGRICIVIAPVGTPLAGAAGTAIAGQWERYERVVRRSAGQTRIVIAGSDVRGTIYGVVDLSRQLGVSPWAWWADVTPRAVRRLTIDDAAVRSTTPSVRYRGIFLNDEDWGLEPWAAKTLEPKTGNIGPHTYRRVFELMWRLKANLLWPAMHSVSTPFYADPTNPRLADEYAIVIGTSHAEPMLRNNLREWDAALRGPFDFTSNAAHMTDYWRERLDQARGHENIYTMGLRGIHDGPMQGASDNAGRRAILEKVVGLQRGLLAQAYARPAQPVPQVYVAYHELQEAYDDGLTLPGDVTLMWADDNYGYLRRLSTPAERQRPGGAGIYYHLSYWGRPHDYLWLGTTHPALIHEEMGRALATDATRMWVVNVGDIKPIEYLSQYFLDLAFDARTFATSPRYHLRTFMAQTFGAGSADDLADVMMRFYDLAFERRPEFMGFGETEWVTPNRPTDYVRSDGEEAQARLAAYAALVTKAEAIGARMPADRRDAYFELVLYPVRGAAKLHERILKLDLARLYAEQGRASANIYVDQAKAAHAAIVADTSRYNALRDGKWRHIMDMAPRALPVFQEPVWPHWSTSTKAGCGVAYWGSWFNDENTLTFTAGRAETKVVRLFGYRPVVTQWSIAAPKNSGANLSRDRGALSAQGAYEQRLTVRYDGRTAPGDLSVACGGATLPIYTRVLPDTQSSEVDRVVTLPAASGEAGRGWQVMPGLGSMGAALRAALDTPRTDPVVYRFASITGTGARIKMVALPTHPLYPGLHARIAVRIDGGPERVLDFATIGRSDAWRANVLRNAAVETITLDLLAPGKHVLSVTALDPGVMLDRIQIEFDGARPMYGAPRPPVAE